MLLKTPAKKAPSRNPSIWHILFLLLGERKWALFDNIYFLSVGKFIQTYLSFNVSKLSVSLKLKHMMHIKREKRHNPTEKRRKKSCYCLDDNKLKGSHSFHFHCDKHIGWLLVLLVDFWTIMAFAYMKNVWYLHPTVDIKPVNSVCLLEGGGKLLFILPVQRFSNKQM